MTTTKHDHANALATATYWLTHEPHHLLPDDDKVRIAWGALRVVSRAYVVYHDENQKLRAALSRAASSAGHPDAAEGCRIIIKIAKEALA